MHADLFVDTNILVYAHDLAAGPKHETARDLIAQSWRRSPLPWISIQVLQELLVNLRRKGVEPKEARQAVEDYTHWRVIENTLSLFADGLDEMDRWKLSLWDAMILAAARSAGVKIVWSEDLSEEQDYDGIQVVNPLRPG